MTDLNDLHEDSPAKLSRRTVGVGTAWAVPIVMGVGAAPAMAASLAWTITALPTTNINIAYANANTNFVVSGTGVTGQTVTLAVTGLGTSTTQVLADGSWSFTFTTAFLPQGSITFTPTSGANVFAPASRGATKDTIRPTFIALRNPDGINRTLHGVVSADATVTLVPARGTITYGTPSLGTRTWTTVKYKAIDFVGAFTTVTVTAADAAGNASTFPASVLLTDA